MLTTLFCNLLKVSVGWQAIALEKVLVRPESRRHGAKPVLRDGLKFPCLTLHHPPYLQPVTMLTGPSAIADLAKELSQYQSPAAAPPSEAASQAEASGSAIGSGTSTSGRTETATDSQAPLRSVQRGTPDAARHCTNEERREPESSSTGTPQSSGRTPTGVLIVQNGAQQFKQMLVDARSSKLPVIMLWHDDTPRSRELHAALAAAAPLLRGKVEVAAGSPAASEANRKLAAALGVKQLPTCHLLWDMKLYRALAQPAGVQECRAWALKHLKGLGIHLMGPGTSAESSLDTQTQRKTTSTREEAAASSSKVRSKSCRSGDSGGASTSRRGASAEDDSTKGQESVLAVPTGKYAKAGMRRAMPKGTAVFYPRMPCLRCGCPWWLGEDWDSRCARYGLHVPSCYDLHLRCMAHQRSRFP